MKTSWKGLQVLIMQTTVVVILGAKTEASIAPLTSRFTAVC